MPKRIRIKDHHGGTIDCLAPSECANVGDPAIESVICAACPIFKICRTIKNEGLAWEETPAG